MDEQRDSISRTFRVLERRVAEAERERTAGYVYAAEKALIRHKSEFVLEQDKERWKELCRRVAIVYDSIAI